MNVRIVVVLVACSFCLALGCGRATHEPPATSEDWVGQECLLSGTSLSVPCDVSRSTLPLPEVAFGGSDCAVLSELELYEWASVGDAWLIGTVVAARALGDPVYINTLDGPVLRSESECSGEVSPYIEIDMAFPNVIFGSLVSDVKDLITITVARSAVSRANGELTNDGDGVRWELQDNRFAGAISMGQLLGVRVWRDESDTLLAALDVDGSLRLHVVTTDDTIAFQRVVSACPDNLPAALRNVTLQDLLSQLDDASARLADGADAAARSQELREWHRPRLELGAFAAGHCPDAVVVGACDSPRECAADERCIDGTCQTWTGNECERDADCTDGLVCESGWCTIVADEFP